MWLPLVGRRPSSLAVLLAIPLLAAGCRPRQQPRSEVVEGKAPSSVKILYPAAPGSFVKLVERTRSSVVHLGAAVAVRGGPADWFPPVGQEGATGPTGEQSERLQRSLGSGFVISGDGSILTNAHVVAKTSELEVRFHDGTTGRATVVGQDVESDVALLRLDSAAPPRLSPLRLGDSDQLQSGEWVLALGNPFGLGQTASAGIVSSRELQQGALGQRSALGLIQTDAAIHPGNSGGPLVNLLGEVVGIATAVEPPAVGVGFAVPINVAKRILPMLRREGKVVRAWVGIYGDQVTEQQAKQVGLKQASGALVSALLPRGPAERAGLRAGDIILSFDGKPVRSASELPWLTALAGVGREVPVEVWRKGKTLRFSLKTEPMPQ